MYNCALFHKYQQKQRKFTLRRNSINIDIVSRKDLESYNKKVKSLNMCTTIPKTNLDMNAQIISCRDSHIRHKKKDIACR